jgi:metal-responsive CopG/Arc/MetJ family transcriptional regulator
MNTAKIAITISKDVVAMIDTLSKESGLSRSRYISNVLRENVMKEKERALKEKYDRVFSDNEIKKEQLKMATWFEGNDVPEGQEW